MTLDDKIKNAIQRLVDAKGNKFALAKSLDISPSTVTAWLNGNSKEIRSNIWPRLIPMIKPFLSQEYQSAIEFNGLINAIPEDKIKFRVPEGMPIESNAHPMSTSEIRRIPVLGIAQAVCFDRTLQSIESYAAEVATEYAPGINGMDKEHIVAFKTDGVSMEPFYPDGTIVYLNVAASPRNGKRVVAKLKNEQAVVFKIFMKEEGKTRLVSINEHGRNFEFTGPKDNPFEWIYPVKYSFRDEHALDAMLDEHDIDRNPKI